MNVSNLAKPNLDQVLSMLRTLIAIGGGYAVGRGWVQADTVVSLTGAVMAVTPFIWGIFAHTDDAKLKSVEAMPEVKEIVKETFAAPTSAMAEAVRDPERPKVVSAKEGG